MRGAGVGWGGACATQVELAEARARAETATAAERAAVAVAEERRVQLARLEDDLAAVSRAPAAARSPDGRARTSTLPLAALADAVHPELDETGGPPAAASGAAGSDGGGSNNSGTGADASLVPILSSQRDRYRRRAQELDEVRQDSHARVFICLSLFLCVQSVACITLSVWASWHVPVWRSVGRCCCCLFVCVCLCVCGARRRAGEPAPWTDGGGAEAERGINARRQCAAIRACALPPRLPRRGARPRTSLQ
jgi:hypothetical protein